VILLSLLFEALILLSLRSVPSQAREFWQQTVDQVPAIIKRRGPLAIVLAASRVAGTGLVVAWALGSAIELLCKHVLVRPALHDGSFHIAAFDSSFPSGHALRAVLVAFAIARSWPRVRPLAVAWVVASVVLLQLAGWHTPSDLAGGLLLGGLAVLSLLGLRAAGAFRARRLPARR